MPEVAMVLVVALLAGIPSIAAAQSSDPALPAIIEPGPRPLDGRPMRFLLSTGAVVIGTRIGETSSAIGVRTGTGIATIQKADLVTMDYAVQAGRAFDLAHHMPVARPAPPLPPDLPPPEPVRHPGRGMRITGGIVLGLTYTVAIIGAGSELRRGESGNAGLLAIPVAGPAIWGFSEGSDRTMAIGLTVGEVIGAALLIFGTMAAYEDDGERPHRRLALAPLLTREAQGLLVAGPM